MQTPYRPEFEAALRLFARVSEAMAELGYSRPILVGGAAAEFYSKSAINTATLICVRRAKMCLRQKWSRSVLCVQKDPDN